MTHAPIAGFVFQRYVLENISTCWGAAIRAPEDWPGSTGHPVRVVDSLTSHLFGRYPTPRFLAWAWFGGPRGRRAQWRRWIIALAQGRSVRNLPLPMPVTRRMLQLFLTRTPDHVSIDDALRRAEVLGLGGSTELADAVAATHLAEDFTDADRWRVALQWLVNCGEEVELAQVRPLVDFLRANLRDVDLRGRTFASAMRLVRAWHDSLGRTPAPFVCWQRSRWSGVVVPIAATRAQPRSAEWTFVELLDSDELADEGRALRHCVATYADACVAKRSSIWSLRHRHHDEPAARSVLTIEVSPASRSIVQVRGVANSLPRGEALELVRWWAFREGLTIHHSVPVDDVRSRAA